MKPELTQAQKAIRNAHKALGIKDRSTARRWAEQATKLAPELEDPWLILASVSSPKASVAFIERALQINPDSPRAQKGMRWALNRLRKVPAAQRNAIVGKQGNSAKRRVAPKKVGRTPAYLILLLAFGCIVVIAVAWTASISPVMASILNISSQSNAEAGSQVWAQVEISKPGQTSEPAQALVEIVPAQESVVIIEVAPTQEASTIVEVVPAQPASVVVEIVPIQPAATPTAHLALATEAATTDLSSLNPEIAPTETPVASSTPSGSFVMDIIENTPVPTQKPTEAGPAATAKAVQAPVGNGVRWIEVNLSTQSVYAWEGDVLMNSFIVSTGTWQTPTVVGTFNVWNKTRIQTMSGPGYSLPNVPFVMYFYQGYGFHGTYWHNNFGTPMSHGCINLTIPDSEWLYKWASVGTTVKVHY